MGLLRGRSQNSAWCPGSTTLRICYHQMLGSTVLLWWLFKIYLHPLPTPHPGTQKLQFSWIVRAIFSCLLQLPLSQPPPGHCPAQEMPTVFEATQDSCQGLRPPTQRLLRKCCSKSTPQLGWRGVVFHASRPHSLQNLLWARSLDCRGCPLATPLTVLELCFPHAEHIERGRWDAWALVLAQATGTFVFGRL